MVNIKLFIIVRKQITQDIIVRKNEMHIALH